MIVIRSCDVPQAHCDGLFFKKLLDIDDKSEDVGYTVSIVDIPAQNEQFLPRQHNFETGFVVSGYGVLTELSTLRKTNICSGILFVLEPDENYRLIANTPIRIIAVRGK